jgi:NAD(P)-dependent dehydrogenase (short-subunit alcohol dehydrogenase family)
VRLKDHVAVVTGGGSGIGTATALLFAQEGARVAIVDRDGAGAEAAVSAVRSLGGEAFAIVADVGDPAASLAGAAAILDRWGRIDVLVTAAGFSCGGTVLTTEPEDWDRVFRANVGGTWLWSRAVIPAMQRQGGGTIVTVASQLALAGGRGNAAYIAAKGAILSLTRTMALDHAEDGIRVNALVPGAVDTPMLRRSFARRDDPAAAERSSRERHAMRRLGAAEEVAEAALFLASSASSFTTGAALPVDGGWLVA